MVLASRPKLINIIRIILGINKYRYQLTTKWTTDQFGSASSGNAVQLINLSIEITQKESLLSVSKLSTHSHHVLNRVLIHTYHTAVHH